MREVAIAVRRMIEYIFGVRIPRVRPIVATMISIAPRAFIPAPRESASQCPSRVKRAPR